MINQNGSMLAKRIKWCCRTFCTIFIVMQLMAQPVDVFAASKPSTSPRMANRLDKYELQRVKNSYNKSILNEKRDPYKKLMKRERGTVVAGPAGSNLIAMTKIRNSGKGGYYRNDANKALANNAKVQNDIQSRVLKPGEKLLVDPRGRANPKIVGPDGKTKALEWHHSPNHIASVSLIRKDQHRKDGRLKDVHYKGRYGGNEMYNTKK